MGFPFGDGLYGRGLYSRRPDTWRNRPVQTRDWTVTTSGAPAWTVAPAESPASPRPWKRVPSESPNG
jgi:hypothetical protein